jgi:hypothetical protein
MSGLPGLALLDLSPGKTVRSALTSAGDRVTLTISHSESGENKGQITDRAAIRLEVRKDNVTDIGTVTAQATIVVSSPRNGFTSAEVTDVYAALIATIMDDGTGTFSALSPISRIVAGEP